MEADMWQIWATCHGLLLLLLQVEINESISNLGYAYTEGEGIGDIDWHIYSNTVYTVFKLVLKVYYIKDK